MSRYSSEEINSRLSKCTLQSLFNEKGFQNLDNI